MADAVEIEVKGMAELAAALRELPLKLNEKIQGSSLLAGAVLVRDEAKRQAPELKVASKYRLAGVLKRNIRMARSKPVPGMTSTVIIGVRKFNKAQLRKINRVLRASAGLTGKTHSIAANDAIGNPFYWRFMEFGYTDRSGKWHGPHGGSGFLRSAFADKQGDALKAITAALAVRVEIAARLLGFKPK